MSAIEIVEAGPADRRPLIELLRLYLTPRSNERRFHWFYEENPHGCAALLVARAVADGRIVGSGAVVPRLLRIDGRRERGSVMADFWIHPEHRSLGPALQLQRACVRRAADFGPVFYDLPQGNMPAVYRRLKMLGDAALVRHVRPLRTGPFIANAVGRRAAAALGGVCDVALRVRDAARRLRAHPRVERLAGRFGPEFDDLAPQPGTRCVVERSAAYLNWRYRDHFLLDYTVLVTRRGASVDGYIVLCLEEAYAEIVDLYPASDGATVAALVEAAAAEMRERGAIALSASWLSGTAADAVLRASGFTERGRRPFVLQDARSGPRELFAGSAALAYGDIDY